MNGAQHWRLYILKLEHEKWYVGITTKDPKERFQEHLLQKRGAYWTMKHQPLAVELEEDLGIVNKEHAEKYENEVTRKLMRERGLNNVRGGDLRDVDEYIVRFGWVYLKEQWELLTLLVFFMLLSSYLLFDKFIMQGL